MVRPAVWYFGAAFLLALASVFLGQVEFGAYDGSMLVDAGWRMFLHQRPYVDFPTLLPPSFLLSTGAALRLFGVHWYAFTLGESLFYLLLATVGWFLVHLGAPALLQRSRNGICLAYLGAISVPHLTTPHLWHATYASMLTTCLLLAAALQSMASDTVAASRPRTGPFLLSSFQWLSVAVAGALWLGKPNIALTAFASTLFFIPLQQRRLAALLFWLRTTGLGFAFAVIFLLLCRINPRSVALSYMQVSDRPAPFLLVKLFFGTEILASSHADAILIYSFVILALITLCVNVVVHWKETYLRTAIPVALAGAAVTIVGLCTNWDIRSNDIAPFFFASAFCALGPFCFSTEARKTVRVLLLALCSECLLLAFVNGVHHTRMLSVGFWAGDRSGTLLTRNDPFFGRFTARQDFWQVLDQIDQDRRQHPSGNVFFGEHLEFQYARLHIPSPLQLPIWWHAGSSYPVAATPSLVREWTAHSFHSVYLFDTDRMPPALLGHLTRYDLVSPPGSIVKVYRLRGPSAP